MRMLALPVSEKDVRSLKIGETVYLEGVIVTARDKAHMRALQLLKDGKDIPAQLKGGAVFHCGPIMRKTTKGWEVVAAGPTTSARMDSVAPDFIKSTGTRIVIGKGGMSKEVGDAMKAVGCVYLAATGGAAVTLAEAVVDVEGVDWEDLGMAEALWSLKVSRFGPLVVAMDANGNDLYENARSSIKR